MKPVNMTKLLEARNDRLEVRIPTDLKKRLKKLAVKKGISLSTLSNLALEFLLANDTDAKRK